MRTGKNGLGRVNPPFTIDGVSALGEQGRPVAGRPDAGPTRDSQRPCEPQGSRDRCEDQPGFGDQSISLSMVIGNSRMRLPVAWKTALAMAAAVPTMPISPSPFTPIGLALSSSSTKITSMS